jgi:restriction system protein
MRLSKLQKMDPIAFEAFVGKQFRKMGARVEDTQASADEGVDLILRKGRRMAVVQCKRYQGSVGQPVVRDLYGVMRHMSADEAYLVTTGTITRAARRWAEDKPIHLVDGHRLVEWARTNRLNYDKPSALARSNRQLRWLIGLTILTVLAVYAVSPQQFTNLRNGVMDFLGQTISSTPGANVTPAVPGTSTPVPWTATPAAANRPPSATLVPLPTPALQDGTPSGSGGGIHPGPTAILTPVVPGTATPPGVETQ